MTDRELLVYRTRAMNTAIKKLAQVRELALESKYRRGLVDADDILLITDRRNH